MGKPRDPPGMVEVFRPEFRPESMKPHLESVGCLGRGRTLQSFEQENEPTRVAF